MPILEISQIIFNLVASIAVITLILVTVIIGVAAYRVVECIKIVKKFLDVISKESSELYKKIDKFAENVFTLSFISRFFKKRKKA
jgi:uncharacterized protein YoxC